MRHSVRIVDGPIIGGNLVKIEYLRHAPLLQNLFRDRSWPLPSRRTWRRPSPSPTATTARPDRVTVLSATEMTLRAMVRGISPLYGLLVCVGLFVGDAVGSLGSSRRRSRTSRRAARGMATRLGKRDDDEPLWLDAGGRRRAPYAALGCLAVANFAATKVRRLREPLIRAAAALGAAPQRCAVVGLLLVFGFATFVDSFVTQSVEYGVDRSIGLWLKEHAGPNRSLAGAGHFVVAGYYAKAEPFYRPASAENAGRDDRPLRRRTSCCWRRSKRRARRSTLGWRAIRRFRIATLPQESLPPNCRSKVIVLVREVRQARGGRDGAALERYAARRTDNSADRAAIHKGPPRERFDVGVKQGLSTASTGRA